MNGDKNNLSVTSNQGERDFANQLLGQAQATQAFSKLLTVSTLRILAEVKNRKLYKGLTVNGPDGKLLTVSSFDDYCRFGLGLSRQKVDQDLLNLETFGGEALDAMQRVGLGYRDLRRLRKLPQEKVLEIQGRIINAEDKNEIKELIEEIVSDNVGLKGDIQDLEKALAKRETYNETLEMEKEQLQGRLRQRQHPGPYPEFVEEIRIESAALADKAAQCINDMEVLYAKLENPELDANDDASKSHFGIAATTYYHNLRAVVAKSGRLLALCHEQLGNEINDDIESLPIFTDDEAKAVISRRGLMIAEHQAEKLIRQERLDNAKPRRRGRPAKKKTKKA
ncbi:MAG TPA: hypothetical protein ENI80_03495 [Acidiferrobacteraceae bacterium]|nr:hypothetical protein [Acidiferrobacteraceae bacterium]